MPARPAGTFETGKNGKPKLIQGPTQSHPDGDRARDADGNELRRHQWAKDEAEARERAAAEEDATPNSSTGKPAPAPADGPAAEAKE